MKIFQINNNYESTGGSDIVFNSTVRLLRDRGHRVITLSRSHHAEAVFNGTDYFLKHSASFIDRFYSADAKNKIEQILAVEKPDLIHIHCIIGGVTFSILPVIKKYKIPVIMTIHDFRLKCPVAIHMNSDGEVCEKCGTGRYYNCILSNCSPAGLLRSVSVAAESYWRDLFIPYDEYVNEYIFVSDFVRGKFLETESNIAKKSHVIFNFTENYNQRVSRGNYYLYFGRLAREKGLLTLLEAFSDLPELNLKIAGAGPLKDLIESKKTQNVELLGFKSGRELKDVLHNSSFVIVPSECYETLSLSAVEAFALGKPVIGSRLGALTELLEGNKNGFLFDPKDKADLKKTISMSSALSDDEYNNLSRNAFHFAAGKFSEEVYYKRLLEVYEKVFPQKLS